MNMIDKMFSEQQAIEKSTLSKWKFFGILVNPDKYILMMDNQLSKCKVFMEPMFYVSVVRAQKIDTTKASQFFYSTYESSLYKTWMRSALFIHPAERLMNLLLAS